MVTDGQHGLSHNYSMGKTGNNGTSKNKNKKSYFHPVWVTINFISWVYLAVKTKYRTYRVCWKYSYLPLCYRQDPSILVWKIRDEEQYGGEYWRAVMPAAVLLWRPECCHQEARARAKRRRTKDPAAAALRVRGLTIILIIYAIYVRKFKLLQIQNLSIFLDVITDKSVNRPRFFSKSTIMCKL